MAGCSEPVTAPNLNTTGGRSVVLTTQPMIAPTTMALPSTEETLHSVGTTSTTTTETTTPSTTTTSVSKSGALEFVDGKLLGISQDSDPDDLDLHRRVCRRVHGNRRPVRHQDRKPAKHTGGRKPELQDYVDEIHVGSPFYLRFVVENNIINWFGIIDCIFEQAPAD